MVWGDIGTGIFTCFEKHYWQNICRYWIILVTVHILALDNTSVAMVMDVYY